jgi:Ca-activated chloride channel homolog
MLTVKLRYEQPNGDTSKLLERPFVDGGAEFASAAPHLKFAAAVAEFGMLLRDSEYKGNATFNTVAQWAQQCMGADPNGYRVGFIQLVRKAQAIRKG